VKRRRKRRREQVSPAKAPDEDPGLLLRGLLAVGSSSLFMCNFLPPLFAPIEASAPHLPLQKKWIFEEKHSIF
jgi:hypothetical protein